MTIPALPLCLLSLLKICVTVFRKNLEHEIKTQFSICFCFSPKIPLGIKSIFNVCLKWDIFYRYEIIFLLSKVLQRFFLNMIPKAEVISNIFSLEKNN